MIGIPECKLDLLQINYCKSQDGQKAAVRVTVNLARTYTRTKGVTYPSTMKLYMEEESDGNPIQHLFVLSRHSDMVASTV